LFLDDSAQQPQPNKSLVVSEYPLQKLIQIQFTIKFTRALNN